MSKRAIRKLAVAVALVTGLVATIRGGSEFVPSARLAWAGKTATAQVMDAQERVSGRFRRHSYSLLVAFQTANQSLITKRVQVSKEVFTAAQSKWVVKVHYLAENPASCVAGTNVKLCYGNMLLGLLVLVGAGLVARTIKRPDSGPGSLVFSYQVPSSGGSDPTQGSQTASQAQEHVAVGVGSTSALPSGHLVSVPAQAPSQPASKIECSNAGACLTGNR